MKSMMYQAYQNHMDLTAPWRTGAAHALKYLNLVPQGVSDRLFGRLAAALELISRTSLTYSRPAYGIDKVLVGNQELTVTEEVAFATPFGLYGAFFVKGASRHFGRPLHSILLFDPRREHSSVPTAYFHRRRAQRRSRTALLQQIPNALCPVCTEN